MAINKSDLFQGDLFGEAKRGAKDLNDELEEILRTLEKTSSKHVISPEKSKQDEAALKVTLTRLEAIEKVLKEIMRLNGKAASEVKPVRDNKRDVANAERLIQAERTHQRVTQALTTTQREQQRVQQQLSREAARTVTVRSREFRELQRLREQNRAYVQGIRQEIRAQGVNRNSIQGLINRTRQLVDARNTLDRSTREGRREFARLNREIVRNRDELQRYNSSISATSGVLGRLTRGFSGVQRAVGLFGAALSVGTIIKSSIDEFKEFESTLTDVFTLLSSADVDKFGALIKEGSLKLMADYGLGIEDVNKSLFDSISAGVDAGKSIEFLNEVAKLAKGGSAELSISVDGVTTALNAYKLNISETSNVAAAFFSAQKEGKTTVSELAQGFGSVAPIASKIGITYQELLSQTAALTKGGISTAEAFTNLKGVYTALLKPTGDAEKQLRKLGIPVGVTELKAQSFTETLSQLNEVAKQNPDIIAKIIPNVRGLTGVLALSGEGFEEYSGILQRVNADIGENSSLAQAAARVQETQAERAKRTTAEFRNLGIQIGEKLLPILNDLKESVLAFGRFLAKNSKTVKFFGKLLVIAAAGFVAFKIATRLARIELAKTKLGLFITGLKTMRKTMLLTAGGMKKGAFSARLFGTALKSVPLIGWLSAIVSVVTALAFFSSSTDDAAAAQEKFNLAVEAGSMAARKSNEELQKLNSFRLAELRRAADARKAAGEDAAVGDQELRDAEIAQIEDTIERQTRIAENGNKKLLTDRKLLAIELIKTSAEITKAQEEAGSIFAGITGTATAIELDILKRRRVKILSTIAELEGDIKGITDESVNIVEESTQRLLDLQSEGAVAIINQSTALTDAQKKELERRAKLLLDFERQIRNVRNSLIEDDQRRAIAKIEAQTEDLIAAAKAKAGKDRKLQAKFDILEIELLRKKKLDIEKIQEKFAEKEEKARKKTRDIITSQIENESVRSIVVLQDKHKDELDELDKSLKKQLISLEEFERRKAAIKTRQQTETQELEDEISIGAFDRKSAEDNTKKQEEFAAQNFENLQDFELKKQEFEDLMLQREIERERMRLQLLKDSHADSVTIAEQRAKLRELELQQVENDLNKEADIAAKQQEARQANLAAAEEFFDMTAERLTERLQREIDALDMVLQQSEKAQARLEALAENSTVNESIAAEDKKQKQILLEKEARAKKQQQIEMGLALLKIFTAELAKAESDSGGSGADTGSALAKTAITSAGLFQLLQTLPNFFYGTEDTGTKGFATDKHGVITGYTHKNERVFTEQQNKIIPKGMNNDTAARVLQAAGERGISVGYDMPVHDGLIRDAAQANTVIVHVQTDQLLLNEVKSMGAGIRANTKAIKNIPRERLETHIDEFQAVIQHTVETNNQKIVTKYKLAENPSFIKWGRTKGFR